MKPANSNAVSPIEISFKGRKRLIGPGYPAFIIGEMSGNHNHQFERAIALIDIAVSAGVDAVKIQTYTPETLTIDCDNEYFQVKGNIWEGETLFSLYQKAYTPWNWQPRLIEYAAAKGVLLFSTPFDESAVDFLENLQVPLYKVASFESTHIPLLRRIGKTGKPVILSRGLTSEDDLALAIDTLRTSGCPQVAVLHCVSSYPAEHAQMNLRTIPKIVDRFGVVSGLSDHSIGNIAPVAAVALGASIIEKHYTTRRSDGGPDAEFSLESSELSALVKAIRSTEEALGQATFALDTKQQINKPFRRSIFVVEQVRKGDVFTEKNLRVIRPGHGLEPKFMEDVLGRTASEDIARGTPLAWNLLQDGI